MSTWQWVVSGACNLTVVAQDLSVHTCIPDSVLVHECTCLPFQMAPSAGHQIHLSHKSEKEGDVCIVPRPITLQVHVRYLVHLIGHFVAYR